MTGYEQNKNEVKSKEKRRYTLCATARCTAESERLPSFLGISHRLRCAKKDIHIIYIHIIYIYYIYRNSIYKDIHTRTYTPARTRTLGHARHSLLLPTDPRTLSPRVLNAIPFHVSTHSSRIRRRAHSFQRNPASYLMYL